MTVSIPLKCIDLREGSSIILHSQTWQDWENILEELSEDRHTRIAYYQGALEIMSPLSRHERPHRLIGYIVTAILDAQGRDWEDFGSTTFYRKDRAGVEPDTCFYVTNADLVRDCMARIDVDIYPPPDLAIESDATSKSFLSAYEAIAVPELWMYGNDRLSIFLLKNGKYIESDDSLLLPDLEIKTLIPQLVKQGMASGASAMLREFRQSLADSLKKS
jgi:Uma2 family endonuclease